MKTFNIALCILLCGCASSFPKGDNTLQAPRRVYHMPPKELAQVVRDVVTSPPLSLGVAEETDGSILTGWQDFPGEFHTARRWQERTRYRISIIPDFNDPANAAAVEVRGSTEQRPA